MSSQNSKRVVSLLYFPYKKCADLGVNDVFSRERESLLLQTVHAVLESVKCYWTTYRVFYQVKFLMALERIHVKSGVVLLWAFISLRDLILWFWRNLLQSQWVCWDELWWSSTSLCDKKYICSSDMCKLCVVHIWALSAQKCTCAHKYQFTELLHWDAILTCSSLWISKRGFRSCRNLVRWIHKESFISHIFPSSCSFTLLSEYVCLLYPSL